MTTNYYMAVINVYCGLTRLNFTLKLLVMFFILLAYQLIWSLQKGLIFTFVLTKNFGFNFTLLVFNQFQWYPFRQTWIENAQGPKGLDDVDCGSWNLQSLKPTDNIPKLETLLSFYTSPLVKLKPKSPKSFPPNPPNNTYPWFYTELCGRSVLQMDEFN